VAIICASINFGIVSGYTWFAICYAVIFGLIGGVQRSEIDFSFLERRHLSGQTKVTKLKSEADKWLAGLSIFTVVLLTIAIGAVLYIVLSIPTELGVRFESTMPVLWGELYLAPGIGFGIYWNIIQKVNEATRKISEVED